MTCSPQPCTPWQALLGLPQQGPVSPGPLKLWLLAKASAGPATCWAHQSVFVSLVSHCIIRTKGPATRAPTVPLCPELAFPKLPNSPTPSLGLQPPLCQHPEMKTHKTPATTGPQHPSEHFLQVSTNIVTIATYDGWWEALPSQNISFAMSHPFLPSFTSLFGIGWERSPFSMFSWQSQKGVWMGRPWELDCVRRALVFMHSRGWAEPPALFYCL